jgi:hypothetical protein
MIYNNYNNPELPGNIDPITIDIRKFLPELYQGSILIITRLSQVIFSHPIQIRKLQDIYNSLQILSNTSGQKGLKNSINAPDIYIIILDPDTTKLAKILDRLPLVLATTTVYLKQVSISLSDYLCLYQKL